MTPDDTEGQTATFDTPSVEEREMYARASIVSDLLRNHSAAGYSLDAQMLTDQADTLWKWVKSGMK